MRASHPARLLRHSVLSPYHELALIWRIKIHLAKLPRDPNDRNEASDRPMLYVVTRKGSARAMISVWKDF